MRLGRLKIMAIVRGWQLVQEYLKKQKEGKVKPELPAAQPDTANKTVACLNAAFAADPNAIHALICNRVPANQALADDPFIIMEPYPPIVALSDDPQSLQHVEYYQVWALGLLNGVLAANGLPLVAIKWRETTDSDGRGQVIGFQEYNPK